MSLPESSAADTNQSADSTGANLRFSLACPKCGTIGWLKWSSLKYRIGCPKCKCSFWMGRNGQLQNYANVPQVRYECPRCGDAGSLPEQFVVHGVKCSTCKLPLARGPDQRLHETKHAEELQRAARKAKRSASKAQASKIFLDDRGRTSYLNVALVFAIAIGVSMGGYWLFSGWIDTSLATTAGRFTRVCLSGNWNNAHQFMEDDAVQRAYFDRWRMRYFTSILDAHRPSGDKVTVTVETVKENPQKCVLNVTLSSPFIGERSHRQHWQCSNEIWLFDATATVGERH
jgi:hypothetical protein